MATHRTTLLAAALCAACLLIFGPTTASSTTVIRMDLEELVANSTVIGVVSVDAVETFEKESRIRTRVDLEPQELWHAPDELESDSTLTLELPGGRMGDIITRVPGVPRFETGERVVVFLNQPENRSSDDKYRFSITGLSQGTFPLATGPDGHTTYVIPRVGDMNLVERRDDETEDTDKSDQQSIRRVPASELHRQTHRLDRFKQAVMDIINDDTPPAPPSNEGEPQ